jgi:hypothetical protein
MIVAVLQILSQKCWFNSIPAFAKFWGYICREVLPIPRWLVLVWLKFLRNVPTVNGESLSRSLGRSLSLVWGFFGSNRKTNFFQLIFRRCDDIIILFCITFHFFYYKCLFLFPKSFKNLCIIKFFFFFLLSLLNWIQRTNFSEAKLISSHNWFPVI